MAFFQVAPYTVFLFFGGLLGIGAALFYLFRLLLRALRAWRPPLGTRVAKGLVWTVWLSLSWGLYRLIVPSSAFYQDEFLAATGMPLPPGTRLVAGCSDWAITAGIYKIAPEHWSAFTTRLHHTSIPLTEHRFHSLCTPSVLPHFGAVDAAWSLRSPESEGFEWSLDTTRHLVMWELCWH